MLARVGLKDFIDEQKMKRSTIGINCWHFKNTTCALWDVFYGKKLFANLKLFTELARGENTLDKKISILNKQLKITNTNSFNWSLGNALCSGDFKTDTGGWGGKKDEIGPPSPPSNKTQKWCTHLEILPKKQRRNLLVVWFQNVIVFLSSCFFFWNDHISDITELT